MTRVVVPYVPGYLHKRVLRGLTRNECVPELRVVTPASGSYRMLLEELFADMAFTGEPLVTVEHDVELRTGVLAGFDACPAPWCFHAYPIFYPYDEAVQGMGTFAPFGCTRFRPSLCDALSTLPDYEPWASLPDHHHLDWMLSRHLADHGYTPHRHPGEMIHWHEYERPA